MKQSPFLLVFLVLAACGDGKKEAAEQLSDTSTAGLAAPTVIDLSSFDVPLMVDLGDLTTLGVDSPEVRWNEEFGRLEVNAGEHFGLIISEEPADIPRLKADLDRDMLRKNTVIAETPEELEYRSQFPDEELVFVHFYQVIRAGEREFVVEDRPEGRFNEADITRMASATKNKQPA
ncbi:MAG TPA: hypothetical protein VKG92_05945 [Flavobacteriales bacterium]|nr:hypothetical protein [Flavobacteriales bacterium]